MAYLPEFDRPLDFSLMPADRDRDEEESKQTPDLAVALIEHLIATGGQRAGVPIEIAGMKFFVCVERFDG